MLRVLAGLALATILAAAGIVGVPLPSERTPQAPSLECALLAAYFDQLDSYSSIFDDPELVDLVPEQDGAEHGDPQTVVLTRFVTRGPGPGGYRQGKSPPLSALHDESRRARGRLNCDWSGFSGVRAVDPWTAIEVFEDRRRWRPVNWFALTRAEPIIPQLSVSRAGLWSNYAMIEVNDSCIGWCGGRGWAVFEKRNGEWGYEQYILDWVA